MNIVIYGGAFNPPTIAHTKIISFLWNSLGIFVRRPLDNYKILIMPCYQHNFNKEMASWQHRYEMCNIMLQQLKYVVLSPNHDIVVSDFEMRNKLSGKTYDMVVAYKELNKKDNIFLAIGQDNADNFEKWYESEKLRSMINFIVIPRAKAKIKDAWYLYPPHIIFKDVEIPAISSTLARQLLKEGKDTKEVLLPAIYDYIKKEKLYDLV